MPLDKIQIKGARVNNLKNIDIDIPLNKFIVVTGVSGSGKSSLAFDTLYAEGQRRYVESLSAYARQFLGRMPKPECDYVKNLPPAIAIEQKVNTRNPRSTVGTATEIYDYLRMLFARIGHTFSPVSGKEVKRYSIDEIVRELISNYLGCRCAVLSEIIVPDGREFIQQIEILHQEGYSRIEYNGEFIDIEDIKGFKELKTSDILLSIDRLSLNNDKDTVSRLSDSLETAFYEGRNKCVVKIWKDGEIIEHKFSKDFEADGITFREPDDLMFNFNNPYGACPECEGFGKILGISEDLVIPDKTLSVYQGAVQCWRGEVMSQWKKELVHIAPKYDFPIHTPYNDLTQAQKDFLWNGKDNWEGIYGFFRWIDLNQQKIQYRVLKARYRGKTTCPSCKGSRLRPDAEYVKIAGKSITDLVRMSISNLQIFFKNLNLNESDAIIAKRLLLEINSRLGFLCDVGLGYLTLDRLSSTLSGGESQRINLATSLGSALVGSLYILDEPSIGLHSRDTGRLIEVLRRLQKTGNSVVVVEHDEELMLSADEIIDVGPGAGSLGGEIVYQGNLQSALTENISAEKSLTLDYLRKQKVIDYSPLRRRWKDYIEIEGATANNLKNINVKIPLGVLTVVSGVSGSGKSTLVRDILYRGLTRLLGEPGDLPAPHKKISGSVSRIGAVTFVDQNPIGTSSRSNPATYLKAFDEIRKLFAEQQLSVQMGYTPAYFSFNTDGGRCDECKGEGTVSIPMQFMADIRVPCESCGGKRFKPEILEVRYREKNIFDILEMTVEEAIQFMSESNGSTERKIVKRLQPLYDVGLGYIKLGQSSSTLSGGENQRVKLAYFLSQDKQPNTFFIFDEPTTGLHFNDISTLLKSLRRLVDNGHSVLIIEHNMDVIKSADWLIDVGPEGGEEGGEIVAEGTPEEVVECPRSYTGKYLKPYLTHLKQ